MTSKTTDSSLPYSLMPSQKGTQQGSLFLIPDGRQYLDSVQLHRLEQSFREWVENSQRADIRLARRRILMIFLLIRYTGAKLNEVLALNLFKDIDFKNHLVHFCNKSPGTKTENRKVQISLTLALEIQEELAEPFFKKFLENRFDVDPGFARRKFYERAEACGFPKSIAGPEMIRKARGGELLQGNMPLPAIQKMLGHATPDRTTFYASFSTDDIQQVTKLFIERESSRKTSARNSFFGKIQALQKGTILTEVILTTISGHSVTAIITNNSLEQLSLKKGRLITAEVKAPWIILQKGEKEPTCSAENKFNGIIEHINKGRVNTEYTVRIADGTVLCSLISTKGAQQLALDLNDYVWAVFNGFAVVLHADG